VSHRSLNWHNRAWHSASRTSAVIHSRARHKLLLERKSVLGFGSLVYSRAELIPGISTPDVTRVHPARAGTTNNNKLWQKKLDSWVLAGWARNMARRLKEVAYPVVAVYDVRAEAAQALAQELGCEVSVALRA